MVCVPCIVIPVFLWVFHKYIQPFILKFWNPWAKKSVLSQENGVPEGVDVSSEEYMYIQKRIKENPVMVFSKTSCQYSKMAKNCLSEAGVEYQLEEIEIMKNCDKIQDMFLKLTGARTVPRVYIGGKCVGGGTDVFTLHNQGKLKQLAQEAGANFKKEN